MTEYDTRNVSESGNKELCHLTRSRGFPVIIVFSNRFLTPPPQKKGSCPKKAILEIFEIDRFRKNGPRM